MILPPEAHALVQVLALHFTNPTYQRFSALMVAALVTTGRRTVANLLRTLRQLAPGRLQRLPGKAKAAHNGKKRQIGLSPRCVRETLTANRFGPP